MSDHNSFLQPNVSVLRTAHFVRRTEQRLVVLFDFFWGFASIGLDNSIECLLIGHGNIHHGACAARRKCKAQIGPREVEKTRLDLNLVSLSCLGFSGHAQIAGALNRCMGKKNGNRLGSRSDRIVWPHFISPVHDRLPFYKYPAVVVSVCCRKANS